MIVTAILCVIAGGVLVNLIWIGAWPWWGWALVSLWTVFVVRLLWLISLGELGSLRYLQRTADLRYMRAEQIVRDSRLLADHEK